MQLVYADIGKVFVLQHVLVLLKQVDSLPFEKVTVLRSSLLCLPHQVIYFPLTVSVVRIRPIVQFRKGLQISRGVCSSASLSSLSPHGELTFWRNEA